MLLSTTTDNLFDTFGYKGGTELAARLGYDALDYNMCTNMNWPEMSEENYRETAKMLRGLAEENGLVYNQAHSPFPSFRVGDEEYNQRLYPLIVRSIHMAGLLGAKQIVVHPSAVGEEPAQMEANLNFYNSLIPYCEEAGVKVALENMFGRKPGSRQIIPNVCSFAGDLAAYYDALDPKYFTVCLDVGHCVLVGQKPDDAIRRLGAERLGALHIHDNTGIEDSHTVPYFGVLDWDAIANALGEIGYQGDFTYEVGARMLEPLVQYPEMMEKIFDLMAVTGKMLIRKVEAVS